MLKTVQARKRNLKDWLTWSPEPWEHHAEITPDHEIRQRPTPMAIYKLLPLTNCKQCGKSTCYNFAIKFTVSQKKLADCSALAEPKYAEKLAARQR